MGVTIFYQDGTQREYSENECVFSQLNNASSVKIGIENPKQADCFLSAIYDVSGYFVLPPIDIKVDHKDTIVGARLAKKAKCISKNIAITWLIKEIVKNQVNLESKLDDILLTIKEKINA